MWANEFLFLLAFVVIVFVLRQSPRSRLIKGLQSKLLIISPLFSLKINIYFLELKLPL